MSEVEAADCLSMQCDKLYHNNDDESVQELYTFGPRFCGVERLKDV